MPNDHSTLVGSLVHGEEAIVFETEALSKPDRRPTGYRIFVVRPDPPDEGAVVSIASPDGVIVGLYLDTEQRHALALALIELDRAEIIEIHGAS